jgi:hypothetical protein
LRLIRSQRPRRHSPSAGELLASLLVGMCAAGRRRRRVRFADAWRCALQAASLRSQACVFECAPTLAPVALFVFACRRWRAGAGLYLPALCAGRLNCCLFIVPS